MRTGRSSGFTIVEVLIVLAVTGAMLLGALLLISGRQNVASYNQAIRNIQNELQQIINDVGSGYYQNNNAIRCVPGGPLGGPQLSTAAGTGQGTNKDCVFIGKALQFGMNGVNSEAYNAYTVVGLTGNTNNPYTDLASARARVIARSLTDPNTVPDDAFDTNNLIYGLTVSRQYHRPGGPNPFTSVAFTANVSSLSAGDGSQQVNVIGIRNTFLDQDRRSGVSLINTFLGASTVNPPNGVRLCFNSGGTEQSGLITLGGGNRQGAIDLKIFTRKDCV